MKKIIRLTESDLSRIVRRVILEEEEPTLPECITFIKTGDKTAIQEPMDPNMAGQGTVINNVVIKYNPTVAPGYRSITMYQNDLPFCSTKVQ